MDSVEYLFMRYSRARDVGEFMMSLGMSDRRELEAFVGVKQLEEQTSIQDKIADRIQVFVLFK